MCVCVRVYAHAHACVHVCVSICVNACVHAHVSKHVDVFGRLTQLEEFVEEFEHFGDERGAHSLTGDGQQKTGQV